MENSVKTLPARYGRPFTMSEAFAQRTNCIEATPLIQRQASR